MKKFLALFLVLAMLATVALVSCDKTNDNTNDDDDLVIDDNPDDTTPGGSQGDDKLPGGDTTDVPPPANTTTETAISATIYPMTKMYIRKDSTTSDVKVIVERAQALTAVAVIKNADGVDLWYKLSYNNETYYIDADFATQNLQKATFTNLSETLTITVKQHGENEDAYQVNLRKNPSFDENVEIVTVKKEHTDVNPIVAKASNGTGDWYFVTYNGQDYYLAVTSVTKPVLNGLPAGGGEVLPG